MMEKAMRTEILLMLTLALVGLVGCASKEEIARKRAELAQKARGDIVIAVLWNTRYEETLFSEGVALALEEVNRSGGVLKRKLRAATFYGDISGAKELRLARKIAKDPEIMAVIGHDSSDGAIPASVIYETHGLLFISPRATSPQLTSHGFQYVFRNIPSDSQTGQTLAQFAHASGFKKVAVLDDESAYGQLLAESFIEQALKQGIAVKAAKSYFPWQSDFRPLLADIKALNVEAIFLGGQLPRAAEVIRQAREMGVTVPFISGDGLDSPTLWEIAGAAAEGTIVSTVFNAECQDEITRRFIGNFYARYGRHPDTWAAQGYDAVQLLAHAFTEARSTSPVVVASYLHFVVRWQGVTGSYSFMRHGDIIGKEMYFKVVRNGRFQCLDFVIENNGE